MGRKGKKNRVEVVRKGVPATLCQIFQKVEGKERMRSSWVCMTRLVIPAPPPRSQERQGLQILTFLTTAFQVNKSKR